MNALLGSGPLISTEREIDRLYSDFLHTYRETRDLREQLAVKEGRLADIAQELQEASRGMARTAVSILAATSVEL